jgi:hypothetical protein
MLTGETQLWCGNTLVWRALRTDEGRAALQFPEAWTFVSGAGSFGAGTVPVDVVAGPPLVVYFVVGGVRRLKVNVTALEISADAFDWVTAVTISPARGPVVTSGNQLLLQVMDEGLGEWVPYARVGSDGTFGGERTVAQKKG